MSWLVTAYIEVRGFNMESIPSRATSTSQEYYRLGRI
jgi:hypothetical protein